jgi:hypothetical protein
LIFTEGGKPEDPEKNPLWQGREPTNNSTHMKYPAEDRTQDPLDHSSLSNLTEIENFGNLILHLSSV